MLGHEDTRSALLGLRALLAKTLDLAGLVDLVELEDVQLDRLVAALDLLRLGVRLLLALLAPPRRRSTRCRVASFWML